MAILTPLRVFLETDPGGAHFRQAQAMMDKTEDGAVKQLLTKILQRLEQLEAGLGIATKDGA